MKKNFYLDILLFISGLICIVTGICLDFHFFPHGDFGVMRTFRNVHIYSGYIMAAGIIFHIVWHIGWVKSAAKQIFKKN